ncbi:hypothetical protein [Deinococcus arcticus]|uniref:hypothetical protein n=1 Tax=Deinococcus arcticus TaxID=2136176 RepID=UPI0011B1E9FA|nr:hypothetical protein [Deinococcus arcticus]
MLLILSGVCGLGALFGLGRIWAATMGSGEDMGLWFAVVPSLLLLGGLLLTGSIISQRAAARGK